MIVQVHQDPRYYEPQNLIPDGTILKVVKQFWHYRVLTAVHVLYKNRDIMLWMLDVDVIEN